MPLIDAALILAAYLLGSLSGSLLLGRLRGVDIRTQGSGNAGGTNALRTQGWRFALGTVLVDVGKGLLAAWLALRFGSLLLLWPLGLAVVIGSWLLVLVLSGYVGLSTILAVATLLPLAFFTEAGLERWAFAAAMALFILYTHRGNLQRMRAGVENRFERVRLLRRRTA
jgi:glycerol-3-phosphate acyltransferase PlsY